MVRVVVAVGVMKDIIELARSFHVLDTADGIEPWAPTRLDAWAMEPMRGDATRYAAQFVLSVWDYQRTWKCGRFDMVKAIKKWDKSNKEAFLAWTRKVWFA